MSYKQEVVQSAIEGLRSGGGFIGQHADLFRNIFEQIYEAGFNECMRQIQMKAAETRYSDLISKGGMDPR